MAKSTLTRAVKLTGTDIAEGKRRTLTAGPITAVFDNGALRYIRLGDVEVLRAIAFLVPDENWGTFAAEISDLKVKQGKTGVLDYFFERYLEETKSTGETLIEWAEKHYDPVALKADFQSKSKWWANLLVDRTLNRE